MPGAPGLHHGHGISSLRSPSARPVGNSAGALTVPLCLFQVHVQKAGVSHSFQHRILYLNFSLKDSLWSGLASLCRTEWSVFLKPERKG